MRHLLTTLLPRAWLALGLQVAPTPAQAAPAAATEWP